MKRIIIAAVTAAFVVGTAYAGWKCQFCNGTGWQGKTKCVPCGGDGEQGN